MAHDAPLPGGEDRRPTSHDDEAVPPDTLVAGAVGDRCVNCSAQLVSDQRYCVVCGERRGAPRFTLPPRTPAAPDAAGSARVRRRPRVGQGTTLIAGVATLLLAMLVGVLIGHGINDGQARTVASAPVRIITTGGGTSAATTTTGSSSAATPSKTKKPGKAAHTSKSAKKTIAKEQNAASKVLGGKGTPAATVTVGQSGSGKGYNKKTHKFDGSFFGQ